jgi:precorrin-2 dehydrogenase
MKYYPIFLRVAQRACLVIGGGSVACQKVEALLRAGAAVTVLSPQLTPRLSALKTAGDITHWQRRYSPGDIRGFILVYAATGNDSVDQAIAREAKDAAVWVNVVDRPPLCDFIAPATVERGDLLIATSTSGASPAMAKRIRRDLEATFGDEYAAALVVLRRLRERLRTASWSPGERRRIFTALVESPLVDLLRQGKHAEVDRLLANTVGDGVSLATLGVASS